MLYSEPRYTKDLDIAIGTSPDEIRAFRTALEALGFPMADEAAEDLSRPNRMIKIGHPPARVDFLNQIDGVDFSAAWERRKVVDIDGVEVPFISLPDLIAAKRAAGRPQDLLDLEKLERGATDA